MPIYEYQCQACGARLEVMQKISDAPLTECRECDGKLEKQWSQTSFQLKGSGWYVSDYGKGGVKPAASKSDTKDGKSDGDTAPAKTDGETAKKGDGETAKKSDVPAAPSAPASKSD